MDSSLVIILFLVISGAIWIFLPMEYGLKQIKVEAEKKGFIIQMIRWNPLHGSRGSGTFYNVKYLDPSGILHSVLCEYKLISDKVNWDVE